MAILPVLVGSFLSLVPPFTLYTYLSVYFSSCSMKTQGIQPFPFPLLLGSPLLTCFLSHSS